MKKTLTYGILPEREEFEAAFGRETPNWSYRFVFANDPRVGTCELTCSKLWSELVKAQDQWRRADSIYSITAGSDGYRAGKWCSAVLGVLGFEWI